MGHQSQSHKSPPQLTFLESDGVSAIIRLLYDQVTSLDIYKLII